MIQELRTQLRFAWCSVVIPVVVLLCALIALANVFTTAEHVREDYKQVLHTQAEYKQMHLDFGRALTQPEKIETRGPVSTSDNPARSDYEALATDIVSLKPVSSTTETLKFLGFLIYPAMFFLIGVWLATGQRRYRLDKVALVRAGGARTIASQQLAMIAIAAVCIAATLIVDVVARAFVYAQVAAQLPLSAFPQLSPSLPGNWLAQWGVIALVIVFFGGAGVAVGTLTGVFAVPAIVFLVYNFVVPVLIAQDPRNWFQVLGHSVFTYAGAFELAEPIPLAVPTALLTTLASAFALVALSYVGSRIRNPQAT